MRVYLGKINPSTVTFIWTNLSICGNKYIFTCLSMQRKPKNDPASYAVLLADIESELSRGI